MSSTMPPHLASSTSGTLYIRVCRAKGLLNISKLTKQNPFLILRLSSQLQKTKTDYNGGQNPIWEQVLKFKLSNHSITSDNLEITIMHETKDTPRLIGDLEVDYSKVFYSDDKDETTGELYYDDWYPVTSLGQTYGELLLQITFRPTDSNLRRSNKLRGSGSSSASNGYPNFGQVRALPQTPQDQVKDQDELSEASFAIPAPLPRNPAPASAPLLPEEQDQMRHSVYSQQALPQFERSQGSYHSSSSHILPIPDHFNQSLDFDFDSHLNSIPDLPTPTNTNFNHSGSSSRLSHSQSHSQSYSQSNNFNNSTSSHHTTHSINTGHSRASTNTEPEDFDALLRAVQSDHPRREPDNEHHQTSQSKRDPVRDYLKRDNELPPPPLPPHTSQMMSPSRRRSPDRKPPPDPNSPAKKLSSSPVRLDLHSQLSPPPSSVPYSSDSFSNSLITGLGSRRRSPDRKPPPDPNSPAKKLSSSPVRLDLHSQLSPPPSSSSSVPYSSDSFSNSLITGLGDRMKGMNLNQDLSRHNIKDSHTVADSDENQFQQGFNAPLPSEVFGFGRGGNLPDLTPLKRDSLQQQQRSEGRRSPSRFRP
ncbi:hypothetical protein WICPIJ_001805 [Wickerhamomyces pijperi]|uniref:C2 domain-containing protein n=1 Tax=Wickerhamomyces pijperi TaxID=599730 RepID=A0A9P8QCM1_WICPI|nr:hypothetical protein WICPIJ_001805 [Wickerhamomyces pijperi]